MHYYENLLEVPVHLLADSYEYITKCDDAHNEEHIRAVVRTAYELGRGDLNIVIAALIHDLGCSVPELRETHEHESVRIGITLLKEYSGKGTLFKDVICMATILEAVVEHRSTFKGVRTSWESNVVAAADRGRPNLKMTYYRSYLYALSKLGVSEAEAKVHAHSHIASKCGYGGTGDPTANDLLMQMWPTECIYMVDRIEAATLEDVTDWIDEIKLNGRWSE